MIQSVNGLSNTSAYEKLLEANKKKTSENSEATGALTSLAETGEVTNSTTVSTAKAPITDVIEISAEGRAAVAAQSAQEAESQTLSQAPPDQTLSKMPSAAASQETTSESSETVNLSGLTEDEISDLVDEGTITQADANIELARRAALEAQKEAAEKAAEAAPQSDSSEENSTDEISKNGLAAAAIQA